MAESGIVIIGMDGSGKTVLVTVLAKYLSRISKGVYLDPTNNATINYIEKNWNILQNGDWPESTKQAKIFDLQWDLCLRDSKKESRMPMHLFDVAGQDLRQLFGDDENLKNVPENLSELNNYISEAKILLFLINIKHYVDEPDVEKRISSQSALKMALDQAKKKGKQCALVFTQMDKYQAYLNEYGSLESFCETRLPTIYNAHLSDGTMSIFNVAAVQDVQIKTENGESKLVPKPEFTSLGLDEISDWIVQQVKGKRRSIFGMFSLGTNNWFFGGWSSWCRHWHYYGRRSRSFYC